MDHFERLGLPRRFFIDLNTIEQEYLRRSREVHPDFHQLGTAEQQAASLELASTLNEAYSILRDPFRRADYLLTILGGPSASEMKTMPAAFLEEMLDLRMEMEQLRSTGPDSPGLHRLEEDLQRRQERLLEDAGALLTRYLEENKDIGLLRQCRQCLNASKYVQGLLRDLRTI